MAGQLTATGCLQRDSSASSSSSSTSPSSTAAAGGGFVLKNAKMGGASSSTGSASPSASDPSSRTAGSMSSASASKDVFLMADSSVNLSEHVGHQVMVTGAHGQLGVAERVVSVLVVAVEQRVEPERGQGRDVHGDEGQHDLGYLQHRLVGSSDRRRRIRAPASSGGGARGTIADRIRKWRRSRSWTT